MHIHASTGLTEFLYISCRKKTITAPLFGAHPSAGARGHIHPLLPATRRHCFVDDFTAVHSLIQPTNSDEQVLVIASNKRIVKQNAVESLQQNGNALK